MEVIDFDFRQPRCVLAQGRVAELQEILEETLMNLNTMNAMRHSIPFKEQLNSMLSTLSETGDIMERWIKVQMLWTSLQLPGEPHGAEEQAQAGRNVCKAPFSSETAYQ